MEYIVKHCPQCNGELHIPENMKTCICMYCGNNIDLSVDKKIEEPETQENRKEEYQNSLETIVKLVTDHEIYVKNFTKTSYSTSFMKYVEEGRSILLPVENYAVMSEANKDAAVKETALSLVNVIDKLITDQTPGWKSTKRGELTYQYQFFLAIYTVPMIRYLNFSISEPLVNQILETWTARFQKSVFQLADYDQILAGFNRKGWCFITSAACEALDKKDDCYELMTFRNFRDNYMMRTVGRKKLVEEYYRIAPVIVASIDIMPESKENYRQIWQTYLQPCLQDIERNRQEDCERRYTLMIKELKKKYYLM